MEIMTRHAPSGWTLYRLGQLFAERREKVSDKDFQPLSVTMNGIVPQLDNAAKSDDGDNRKLVRAGDYVINSRSDRKGSGGVSPLDGSVSLISIVLEPLRIHPPFAHHLLRSPSFQEEFYRWGHGIVADLWTTRYSDMKNIRIYLPDLASQNRIADFLDAETAHIDALIEKKQRVLASVADARFATISRALSVGLDDNAPLIETDSPYLPKIPASWRIWRLKHLARVRGGMTLGRTLPEGTSVITTPYLRVANVQAGWVDLSDVAEIDVTETEIKRFSLRRGDVLMNEGGDNDKLGRGAVWHAPFEPCLNQNHVFCVRPSDLRYSDWISMATNARYARDFFYLHSNQSTNLASISKTNVEKLPIAVPPPEEMRAVLDQLNARLDRFTAITEKVTTSINRLREYRASLITAAVTGQIDVTAYARSDSAELHLNRIPETERA